MSRPADPSGYLSDLVAEDSPDEITLTMTVDEARHLHLGMADLLCWARGFDAGMKAGDPYSNHSTIGTEETRLVREKIMAALRAYEGLN